MRAVLGATCVLLTLAALAAPQHSLLRQAAELDQKGRCKEAEALYQSALAAGAPSPALLNNTGNHYLLCGQPEKARSFFERLLSLRPDHQNARLQLARLAVEQRRGAEALRHLARVTDSGPAALLLRAEALHWAGKTKAAAEILDTLEKSAGRDPKLLFTLGLTCARIGLYERAEQAFQSVLVSYPGDFDVLFNLGRAAARAGHYQRARSALEAAVKLHPGEADALLELGLVNSELRDYSRAVFWLAKARKAAPRRADILRSLARAAEGAGYYGDAALALDEYLKLRPDDDTARRDRGRVCARTESRREEGFRELAWYLERHPDDARAHYDLAHLIWRAEPEKALDELAKAISLDEKFGGAYVSRAWLLRRVGRPAEALALLERAAALQPEGAPALDLLGLVYMDLSRPADAEKAFRRALAVGPEDPKILLHLGRALMALDRRQEAAEYLGKFQQVRPSQGRDFSKEPVMIELASLPPAERRRQQIERFGRLAKLRPDQPDLQLRFAQLLLADGRTGDAIREFETLLRRNAPAEVREGAGRSLLRAGHYDLARRFLELAVARRPRARLELAIATFYTSGPERALQVLDQTAKARRKGDYFLLKAELLDACGRRAEAESASEQGLRFAVTRPSLARRAAIFLVQHNRYTDALELLGRTTEAAPGDTDLLLAKAVVRALAGQSVEAETELRQIETRRPEVARTYLVYGLFLASQGRLEEARRKLETAAALSPESPVAKCTLAHLGGAGPDRPPCSCPTTLSEALLPECR